MEVSLTRQANLTHIFTHMIQLPLKPCVSTCLFTCVLYSLILDLNVQTIVSGEVFLLVIALYPEV